MVFVEFDSVFPGPSVKRYFVGADLESVLADTDGGTCFGSSGFSDHRVVDEGVVRALGFRFLDMGIKAIEKGDSKSFYLG